MLCISGGRYQERPGIQRATRQTLEDEMNNNKMSMRENLSLLFYNYTDSSGPWEIYDRLQYQARVARNR